MDIFYNARLRPGVMALASAHARTAELSIVQNPACYVASLRKLVTLNLRYRSIFGGPTDQPTDQARRKAEERYFGNATGYCRVRARFGPSGMHAFVPALTTTLESRQTLTRQTWALSLFVQSVHHRGIGSISMAKFVLPLRRAFRQNLKLTRGNSKNFSKHSA